MPYEISSGPPRSIEIQERIEAGVRLILEEMTRDRTLLVIGFVLVIGGILVTGMSTPDSVEQVREEPPTAAEVVQSLAILIGGIVGAGLIGTALVVVHELCHVIALRRIGVPSKWWIEWVEFRGHPIYPLPKGGVTRPIGVREQLSLTYSETVQVALAPVVLGIFVALSVLVFHVMVAPFEAVGALIILAFFFGGPSITDYRFLTTLPRERWETFVAIEEAIDRHCRAEGIA